MEFRILGPLEVLVDGMPVALGGPRQRALLAVLLLNANRVVSRERLIDDLGASGGHALANQISRLRKALAGRLETRPDGYLLRVAPGELDLQAFTHAVERGRAAREPATAAAILRDAERLWRGPAPPDVELALEDLRLGALEDRIEAELALGRHTELAAELQTLVTQHPLRERLHAHRMLALYRGGRQAEALDAYREARDALVELSGSEPGPDLRRRHEQLLRQDPALDGDAPAICPYKGLAAFGVDDADYFFGRERAVDALVTRAVDACVLAVVGDSGSGKSSLVRAGLLPALARGVLPGSERWTQAVIRPGEPVPDADVLAVDQFEELFALKNPRAFVDALLPPRRLTVVALRADFYGRCAAYPELTLGDHHLLVGPMTREEVRRAIERPAAKAGLTVEPALVEALLDDVRGSLPLLSTALLELWRERDGRTLTLAAYLRNGGVSGAVGRVADAAYDALHDQEAARRLLLRLASEDAEGAIVRRRIPLADADTETVKVLADRRLLTVGDGHVEVAHEALLTEWPRLRDWLEEDAEGRRLHRRLADAARAWEADGTGLYRGARLAAALDYDGELNAGERAFLAAGRRAAVRAQRRLRLALAGVLVLLAGAVVATAVAIDQRAEARAQATEAAAQRLGAQALAEADLDRALLLAREGVALDDTPRTRANLLATLLRSPAALGVLHSGGAPILGLALHDDTLAVLDANNTLRLFDARTRRPRTRPVTVHPFDGDDPARRPPTGQYLRFSPDGTQLFIGGFRPEIRDARTLGVRVELQANYMFAFAALYSGDELVLELGGPGNGITTLQRFDPRSGRPLARPRVLDHEGRAYTLSVVGGQVKTRANVPRTAVAGRTRAVAGEDNRVTVSDGATEREALAGHTAQLTGLELSGDGRTLYSSALDGRVLVWDLAGDRQLGRPFTAGRGSAVPLPHEAPSWSGFGAPPVPAAVAGTTLATGNGDGTVTLVDTRTLRVIETRRVADGAVRGLAFTGADLAIGADRGFLTRAGTRLPGHRGMVLAPAFGGPYMVSGSVSDRVLLWRDGRSRLYTYGPSASLGPFGVALSADGDTLAVASRLGVEIVDTATLRRWRTLPGAAAAVRFDGDRLLAGGAAGARVWSTRTWRPLTPVLEGAVDALDVSGDLLATGGPDGMVRLFDLRLQRRVGILPVLPNHPVVPRFAGGRLLAVADTGHAVAWDVRPQVWARRACAIAGRTLTRAEWADALPERAYAPACRG